MHVVCYEEMRKNLAAVLPGIAKFLGIEMTTELSATVLELSSFQWMKDNEGLFDDHFMVTRQAQVAAAAQASGQPIDYANPLVLSSRQHVASSKVGLQVGDDVITTITDQTRQLLSDLWLQEVGQVTGHPTYAEFAAEFYAEP